MPLICQPHDAINSYRYSAQQLSYLGITSSAVLAITTSPAGGRNSAESEAENRMEFEDHAYFWSYINVAYSG